MRRWLLLAFLLTGWAFGAEAQQDQPIPGSICEFKYSFAAIEDATVLGGLTESEPGFQNRILLEPAFTVRCHQRWSFSSNLVGQTETNGDTHEQLLVRETYGSLSAGDFDFTVGRRIIRWGAGYAFTTIGVLDLPLVATDPTDRLNIREGRDMITADWVGGPQAISVAWSTAAVSGGQSILGQTMVIRYNVLEHGFDTSLIAGHDIGGDSYGGLTFTKAIGQAWELHGEATWREQAALLLGGKFTTSTGVTTIAEFYSPPNIAYYRSSTLSSLAGRQHYGFLRIGKSRLRDLPGWKKWDLYGSVVANLDDHSRTFVLDVERRFGNHFSSYVHIAAPSGKKTSEYGVIPYSASSSIGIRFQQ